MKVKFFNDTLSNIINKIDILIESVSDITAGAINIKIPATIGSFFIDNIGVDKQPVFTINANWDIREKTPKISTLIVDIEDGIEYVNNLQIESECHSMDTWKRNIKLDVHFPKTLKSITHGCCVGVKFQETVIIPKSVTSIGEYAFVASVFEKGLLFESNSKLKTIGSQAFTEAQINGEIKFPKNLTTIESSAFFKAKELYDISFEEDSKLTFIGAGAFCFTDIKHVTLPASIQELDNYCFSSCDKLTDVDFSNTTLTSVPSFTFNTCHSLKNVKLNECIETIGKNAFSNCNLSDFPNMKSLKTILEYAFYNNHLTKIPTFENIEHIDDYAFAANSIKTFDCSLFDSLNFLGDAAFSKNDFEEIDIDKPIPLKMGEQPQKLFSDCTSLKVVIIYNNSSIFPGMFAGCKSLKGFGYSLALKNIGPEAFMSTGIKNLHLAKNIASIGKNAFNNCKDLETVDLSETKITVLPSNVFNACHNIKNVELPFFLLHIDALAFSNVILTKSFLKDLRKKVPFADYIKFDE